jgi:glycosyltransferase involved in cell wall biosynthesis
MRGKIGNDISVYNCEDRIIKENKSVSDLPRISVIIPTRNRANYLKRGLDKILESDYPNLEIIIIDGASTDDTVQLLKSYGTRITKWVSEPDGGEYFAVNKGLNFATGEIIKFMSDDDILLPQSLGIAGRYFLEHHDIDVVFGQQKWYVSTPSMNVLIYDKLITDERSITPRNWIRRSRNVPSHIASFIRKHVIDEVGGMSEVYWPGDVEFWARVAKHGAKMVLLPDHFVDYYLTGENAVTNKARQCQTIFYHTAKLHGNMADVIYVLLTKVLVFEVTNPFRMIAHALGWHPLRWWFNIKAEKQKVVEK